MYDLFFEDVESKLPFRRNINSDWDKARDGQANKWFMDLNYLVVPGKNLDDICGQLVPYTHPTMQAHTIKEIVERLKGELFA